MCKRKNDCIPFLISLTLLIGGNIVFYVFTAPFFWTEIEGGPAAIVALAILLLFLLANLTWAVALDPGYFPQGTWCMVCIVALLPLRYKNLALTNTVRQ
jgi:hypothetical protein